MQMQYLDFDLEIEQDAGRDYKIVARAPAGEARAIMRFPFDELSLNSHLKDLQIALLRSGGLRRRVRSPQEQKVQDFGQRLFEALLSGNILSLYDQSRAQAAQQGKGLRLRLHIQAPDLAALPWEYLYDARQADYLCLSRHTPLVRYLAIQQPVMPLTIEPPLRILGMIASPSNLDPLDIEREQERMREALSGLEAKGLVELTWLDGQTWRDLQRAMRAGPWHIFHFIGHGDFDPNAGEGVIALANDAGKAHALSATELGRLLINHSSLRLVILNACNGAQSNQHDLFSSTAATLARRGIPAVLAMQEEITDHAAVEYTRSFYEALADGLPIDAAVAEARTAMSLGVTNTLEWGTPVLYLRSSDSLLFQLAAQVKQAAELPNPLHYPQKENVPPEDVSLRNRAAVTQQIAEEPNPFQTLATNTSAITSGAAQQARNNSSLIELVVDSVRINQTTDQRVVIYRAVHQVAYQDRYLFIWTDNATAYALAMKLQGTIAPRPLSHDLFTNILKGIGASITRVVISDVIDDIFYAQIWMTLAGKEMVFDARPNDATILALHSNAPIFVEKSVMDRVGITVEDKEKSM